MADVFTDGSAVLQDVAEFTISASEALQISGEEGIALDSQLVPGADHSSYRGDVYALFLALQKVWSAHLHLDCAAVVSILESMLMARHLAQGFEPCTGTCGIPYGVTFCKGLPMPYVSPRLRHTQRVGDGYLPLTHATLNVVTDFLFGERFSRIILGWFRDIPWLQCEGETSLLEV